MAKMLLLFCMAAMPKADCHKDTALSFQVIQAPPIQCAMAGMTEAANHPDADEAGYYIKFECPRR